MDVIVVDHININWSYQDMMLTKYHTSCYIKTVYYCITAEMLEVYNSVLAYILMKVFVFQNWVAYASYCWKLIEELTED